MSLGMVPRRSGSSKEPPLFRKLQSFVGHTHEIRCCRFGDQNVKSRGILATGAEDLNVNLWQVGRPQAITTFSGHPSPPQCLAFDHTERSLAVGCHGGSLQLWNVENGRIHSNFAGHRTSCECVEFHPYGDFFASGSLDTNMKIWDTRRQKCIQTYRGHSMGIHCVRFSPHGRWVVTAGEDSTVKLWDLTAGKLMKEFTLHKGSITSIDFHPDEFFLATASVDRSIKVWNLETFKCVGSTDLDNSTVKPVMCTNVHKRRSRSGLGLRRLTHSNVRILIWDGSESCVVASGKKCLVQQALAWDRMCKASDLPRASYLRMKNICDRFRIYGLRTMHCNAAYDLDWGSSADATQTAHVHPTQTLQSHIRDLKFCGEHQIMAVSGESSSVTLWDACLHTAQLRRSEHTAEEVIIAARNSKNKPVRKQDNRMKQDAQGRKVLLGSNDEYNGNVPCMVKRMLPALTNTNINMAEFKPGNINSLEVVREGPTKFIAPSASDESSNKFSFASYMQGIGKNVSEKVLSTLTETERSISTTEGGQSQVSICEGSQVDGSVSTDRLAEKGRASPLSSEVVLPIQEPSLPQSTCPTTSDAECIYDKHTILPQTNPPDRLPQWPDRGMNMSSVLEEVRTASSSFGVDARQYKVIGHAQGTDNFNNVYNSITRHHLEIMKCYRRRVDQASLVNKLWNADRTEHVLDLVCSEDCIVWRN